MLLAEVAWPIVERIHFFGGDFAISPHGIFVALGFLLGAQFMLRRARQRGVARRLGPNPELIVQGIVTRAAIGAIIGARLFYVITRLDEFPDPLSWFAIWEGGLSLLGGIAGALALVVPYLRRSKVDLRLNLDNLAPGMALGIFIGRVGDLIIGEHLGAATDFFLGWRCTGSYDASWVLQPPVPYSGPMVQGCFDTAVHQTALYDFIAGGLIFVLIVWLERKPRWDGFSAMVFALGYGLFRFISDFAREADKDLVGTFTGTQLTSIAVIVVVAVWVRVVKPWERTPWAWSPPDFDHPWKRPPEDPDEAPEPDQEDELEDEIDDELEEETAEEPEETLEDPPAEDEPDRSAREPA